VLKQRLLLAIGAAAGGIAAAAVVPMAFAHADECDLGDCTLASGGNPTDVVYSGVRPLFEDWKDDQATNVVVSDSSFTDGISGSYDVSEQDYSTAVMDNAIYHFGDFTAAADNPTGIDSGGLAGGRCTTSRSAPEERPWMAPRCTTSTTSTCSLRMAITSRSTLSRGNTRTSLR
jgi:hypothetical protein